MASMETTGQIFIRPDGKQMCFYLPPSVRDKGRNIRTEIKELVEKHGGKFKTPVLFQAEEVIQLVHIGDAGNEKTLQAAEERGEKLYFCTYVSDSVAKGELMNLDEYEVHPPPPSAAPKRARYSWTVEEDAVLLRYASKSLMARRGDTVWEEAERQKITRHSWQAMKERYTKHLAPAQKAKPPPVSLGSLKKESGLTARFDLTAASRAKLKPSNTQTAVFEPGQPSGGSRVPSNGGEKESEGAGAVKEPSAGPGERQEGHVGPSDVSHGVAKAKAAAQVSALKETFQLEQGAQLPSSPFPEKLHGTPLPVTQVLKPVSQVPPSSAGPSGQAPKQSRDRSRTPPAPAMLPQERRTAQFALGAAALSTSGKGTISKTGPPDQDLQTPGTAAAGHPVQVERARQEIGREASPFLSQQPFSQLPDSNFVVPETPPETWDSSQREGEADVGVNGHHDQGAAQRKPSLQEHLELMKGTPSAQMREETGLAGRKHARDESTARALGAAANGKKQRSSAQEVVAREGLAGSLPGRTSSAVLMEALDEERGGDTRGAAVEAKPTEEIKGLREEREASGNPSEDRTALDNSEGAADRRPGAGGGLALPATSGEHAETPQGGQHRLEGDGEDEGVRLKGRAAGAASIAGSSTGEQPDDDGGRQGLSKKLEESRRRRLQKVNGELVGGATEPRIKPPDDRTSDIPQERASEIRAWVAAFMGEYGCSQDNVIKALIEASGEFEAARPLLDQRVAGGVKGPVWTLREDHVLLTHPVGERDTHPAFVNLRDVFGRDAVERRLRFLGRLQH